MNVAVTTKGTQDYTCKVTGSSNRACSWSVAEAGGGKISATGVYAAPAVAGTFHVVATSVADPTASAAATVTVVAPVLGDCSGLGAVGVWQDITPPDFKSLPNLVTNALATDPQNRRTRRRYTRRAFTGAIRPSTNPWTER
jgi:hypothetical protein